jgi:uroporphyrinogen-III synthase
MSAGRPLAGRGVLVTRPREQAAGLAALITEAGGRALVCPTIEIEALADPAAALAIIDRLEDFDLAIFISPNAVRMGLALVSSRRGARPWPEQLRVAAPGRGTRQALERHGFSRVIAPAGRADSEALLALPELAAVGGKRVIIFRGEGGRALLGAALAQRGARVEHAVCYRRARPGAARDELLAAWQRGEVHAVTVSSSEGLANLEQLLDEHARRALRATPLFAPHPRIAEAARSRGIREVRIAAPGDAGMLAGLVAYFRRAK